MTNMETVENQQPTQYKQMKNPTIPLKKYIKFPRVPSSVFVVVLLLSYFLLSVGNGVVVPEARNFVAGLAAIAFGGIFHMRQVHRQRKAVTVSEVHRMV
jgi:hypothetical protein